jgi:hypothetical protein
MNNPLRFVRRLLDPAGEHQCEGLVKCNLGCAQGGQGILPLRGLERAVSREPVAAGLKLGIPV